MAVIRLGVLGAARITKTALVEACRGEGGLVVHGLAARDRSRAEQQAKKLQIPHVYDNYDALLNDAAIDAVYIPLPNALHREWTLRSLEAGKHVMCEKPIASNAEDARTMAERARSKGLILAEAMHSRYHALHEKVREIVSEGHLGDIRHYEAHSCVPIVDSKDIRWRYDLAGGSMMDLGVYAASWIRFLAREEPEVVSAKAFLHGEQIDRRMEATLRFPSGASGRIVCGMWTWPPLDGETWIEGAGGKLIVGNPYAPQLMHKIELSTSAGKRKLNVPKKPSSYQAQWRAFCSAIESHREPETGPDYFVPNMELIDAVYRKAGLKPRGT